MIPSYIFREVVYPDATKDYKSYSIFNDFLRIDKMEAMFRSVSLNISFYNEDCPFSFSFVLIDKFICFSFFYKEQSFDNE